MRARLLKALNLPTEEISDTVTVTSDGTTQVDTSALFKKPHIRKMLDEMRRMSIVRPAPPRIRNA